jgi:outer membrane protein OmpA-like peptidoglycan-associated protein
LAAAPTETVPPLKNNQLSEDRARATMVTLASMGVSADRLQTKGYGPRHFVRPNNTATSRTLLQQGSGARLQLPLAGA